MGKSVRDNEDNTIVEWVDLWQQQESPWMDHSSTFLVALAVVIVGIAFPMIQSVGYKLEIDTSRQHNTKTALRLVPTERTIMKQELEGTHRLSSKQ